MYLHVPVQTAARFEEAMRHLATTSYTLRHLFRCRSLRDADLYMRFAGLFTEGLKNAGAIALQGESGWRFEEGGMVCVLIPEDQARVLISALSELPAAESEFEGLFRFSDGLDVAESGNDALEALSGALEEVGGQLQAQLEQPVSLRPGAELQSAA